MTGDTAPTKSGAVPLAIIDLHVDLLSYLVDGPNRTPYDSQCHCSVKELLRGNVKIQILPVFSQTGEHSLAYASAQLRTLKELPIRAPEYVPLHAFNCHLDTPGKIRFMPAIENASCFCSETELLQSGLNRLNVMALEYGPFMYCSLTWNGENRFGGGSGSSAGLKPDGVRLLEHLEKLHIAVDISHASDALAREILDLAGRPHSKLRVLASHSNLRTIANVERNIPDDIAKGIFRCGGILGLTSITEFIGSSAIEGLRDQIVHASALHEPASLCLAGDFFCEADLPIPERSPNGAPMFAPFWSSSSAYQDLATALSNEHGLDGLIDELCYQNAYRFIQGCIQGRSTS